MKLKRIMGFVLIFGLMQNLFSQNIPSSKVVSIDKLSNFLKKDVKEKLGHGKAISEADLARYLREKFSERYFFNWENFETRFSEYKSLYPNAEQSHANRALDHMGKFPGDAQWVLPFNYQNGEPVNAYALRHLARQHKMVDIAYYYFYQDKNPEYLTYFTNQVASLNTAFEADKYEKIKDGNGVYESFRSGYRVLNWLQIHNMFLGEKAYTDQDQLMLIATLLQHAAHLYKENTEFVPGNHQTRGVSALAMISILLRDFKGTDQWYAHAMNLLEQHLSKEINDDGFQFERTVHYHMSDIGNYYYVYQLAKLSNYKVNDFWTQKLESLFVTLTEIAYPDKSAPVLSDDTNSPWAEKNNISGALTLGYLLFDSPKFGYFSNNHVESKMFWYVTGSQLEMLDDIKSEKPTIPSIEFPTTGYYIMREGWNSHDKMLVVSAGLDADKPDHQHGDMLGIQAMAYGKTMLPNYQVRYSLKDYGFFKNSMTKNVALVDNELQGKQYTSNQGGSGFGKFLDLPQPKTIAWSTNEDLDVFIGSHDGFENIGVDYSRQVIYLSDDFWIVKDNFTSDNAHEYKQVWQGHYSFEDAPNVLRSNFDDASGLDIVQLREIDAVKTDGLHGKQWSVVSTTPTKTFSFITVLHPYKGYSRSVDVSNANLNIKGWQINASSWAVEGANAVSLTKDNKSVFFDVKSLKIGNTTVDFSYVCDVFVILENNELTIQLISQNETTISISHANKSKKTVLKPGDKIQL